MWREILRIINEATVEGLSQGKVPVHEDDFLSALRHSNEVFAAMKTHQMGEDMAKKLLDGKGKLKPFERWRDDVSSIARHHVGPWLKTEYNTAVIRAHAAADWREFERNKDILPNLRWMPTTSAEPDSAHKAYWQMKLTLPVDDPFWDEHHPGDRWNCKCSLEATDDPEVRPKDFEYTKPQRGLENNPGKTAEMFSDNHPYYPSGCSKCPFNKGFKNKVSSFFRNEKKHCHQCSRIDLAIHATNATPPDMKTYHKVPNSEVWVSKYHGKNEVAENIRLAKFINKKLDKEVYLLPRLDPKNPKEMELRPLLLPLGVKEGKNPDFLIEGRLFDGKSMFGLDRNADDKKQKNAIENHIKKAKKQAENVVLEIPSFVSRKLIHRTINNYLGRSSNDRMILVHWKNKLLIYGK